MKFQNLVIISFLTISLLSFIGIFFNFKNKSKFGDCYESKIISNNKIGGSFELKNENNKIVNETDILKEPALIYFGYSFCPDICPYDLARNSETVDILEERGLEITPIFITLDPSRDTAERIKDYTNFFHPKMIGLTGSEGQINDISKKYKIYRNVPNIKNDDYLVDHSTFTYFVHNEIGFLEYYNREDTSYEIADSISCFLKKIN